MGQRFGERVDELGREPVGDQRGHPVGDPAGGRVAQRHAAEQEADRLLNLAGAQRRGGEVEDPLHQLDRLGDHLGAERALSGEQAAVPHRLVDQVHAVGEPLLLAQHLVEAAQERPAEGVAGHLHVGPARVAPVDPEATQPDVGLHRARTVGQPAVRTAGERHLVHDALGRIALPAGEGSVHQRERVGREVGAEDDRGGGGAVEPLVEVDHVGAADRRHGVGGAACHPRGAEPPGDRGAPELHPGARRRGGHDLVDLRQPQRPVTLHVGLGERRLDQHLGQQRERRPEARGRHLEEQLGRRVPHRAAEHGAQVLQGGGEPGPGMPGGALVQAAVQQRGHALDLAGLEVERGVDDQPDRGDVLPGALEGHHLQAVGEVVASRLGEVPGVRGAHLGPAVTTPHRQPPGGSAARRPGRAPAGRRRPWPRRRG